MARARRIIRWALMSVTAILLVIAIGLVVVQTNWFKEWLRGQAVKRAAAILDADLHLRRLSGDLWSGVTLEGVDIVQRGQRVVAADRIQVRYHLWTLLRREWVFDDIVLERADVRVQQTPAGWNVAHLVKPRPSKGGGVTLAITRLRMIDSAVAVTPARGEPRTLLDVDLDTSLHVTHGKLEMDVAALHAVDEATGMTIDEFAGTAADNFREFDVTFAARAPGAAVAGHVSGAPASSGRTLDADLNVTHLNVATWLRDPRWAMDVNGHIVAKASLVPGGSSSVTFQFRGSDVTAAGYSAQAIDATGDITGERVAFRARTAAYGAKATVTGAWRFASNGRRGEFTGKGVYDGLDLRRLPAVWHVPPLDTVLAGTYDVRASADGGSARTTLADSIVEGARIANGTEGTATWSGGLTQYAGGGVLAGLDVRRLAAPLQVPVLAEPRWASDLGGRFYVYGRETGATAGRLIAGGASLENSVWSGTWLPRMHATVHILGSRLAIDAQGEFEALNETTAAPLPGPIALTGDLNGAVLIRDTSAPLTVSNLDVEGRVALGTSTVRDVSIDAATAEGRLASGLLELKAFEVRREDDVVRASGTLALGAEAPASASNLQVVADVRELEKLASIVGAPIAGAATLDATVTGQASSPSAKGKLTLRELKYGDAFSALVSTVTFAGDWPDRDSDRLSATLDAEASFVEVKGQQIQQLTAKVRGGLTQVDVEMRAEQLKRSIGLQGLVVIQKDSQELRLQRLSLETQGISWALPDGRTAIVRYGQGRIAASDLALVRGAQRIDISGELDLAPPVADASPAQGLAIAVTQVQVADMNRLLLGTRNLSGRIDGTVAIHGTRQTPIVDADLAVREGAVEGIPFASAVARVRFADGRATVDATLEESPGAVLKVTGLVPVARTAAEGAGLDLRVTGGPVALGLAQAFTTEMSEVAGTVAVDMAVTGSIADPDVHGTATVAGGAFVVAATGARYHGLEADVRVEHGHVDVDRMQILDADGDRLTAAGGLDVLGATAGRQLDVKVSATKFNVLRNQFGAAELDADMQLTGTLGSPSLSGTLSLNEGKLEVGPILERTTRNPYSTTAQAPLDAPEPAAKPVPSVFDRIAMDLRLDIPDNLVLRGRSLRVRNSSFGIGDMNILVGGSFTLKKPADGDPDLRGTASVVRGSYTFQGRRFDVARDSVVQFRGGPPTDPSLNLTATREVSGITATVRLFGSTRSPEVALSSEPPLDEGDILSLIVFNQPMNSLGASERVNLGERAASMAATAIATPLADSIARVLNLDVVELQPPASEGGTGAVSLGGRLGSRVFVGLRQEFGREDASILSLEYRVTEVLRFVTSVAQGALQAHATRRLDQNGVDLIFVIRY